MYAVLPQNVSNTQRSIPHPAEDAALNSSRNSEQFHREHLFLFPSSDRTKGKEILRFSMSLLFRLVVAWLATCGACASDVASAAAAAEDDSKSS
jgi:hypothetical protein